MLFLKNCLHLMILPYYSSCQVLDLLCDGNAICDVLSSSEDTRLLQLEQNMQQEVHAEMKDASKRKWYTEHYNFSFRNLVSLDALAFARRTSLPFWGWVGLGIAVVFLFILVLCLVSNVLKTESVPPQSPSQPSFGVESKFGSPKCSPGSGRRAPAGTFENVSTRGSPMITSNYPVGSPPSVPRESTRGSSREGAATGSAAIQYRMPSIPDVGSASSCSSTSIPNPHPKSPVIDWGYNRT